MAESQKGSVVSFTKEQGFGRVAVEGLSDLSFDATDLEQKARLLAAYVDGHRSPAYSKREEPVEGNPFECHRFDGSARLGPTPATSSTSARSMATGWALASP